MVRWIMSKLPTVQSHTQHGRRFHGSEERMCGDCGALIEDNTLCWWNNETRQHLCYKCGKKMKTINKLRDECNEQTTTKHYR